MTYSADFFDDVGHFARSSAAVVVPIVMDLVAPLSVVDVGCGTGAWLAAFREHDVRDLLGVDGDYAIEHLEIAPEHFMAADLRSGRVDLPRHFDLAVCLELAEHLPATSAASLVATLTSAAPIVLFSAAIPGQRGVEHVNCQWPGYWAELFAAHEFVAVDALRPLIWDEPDVAWWYAQNAVFYATRSSAAELRATGWLEETPRSLVHPRYLDMIIEWAEQQRQ